MSSKLIPILIIAVIISQINCEANVKDKATIAKLKLSNSLNGAKNAAGGLADSAKSKASDSAKSVSDKVSSGTKSVKNKISDVKKDVADIAKAKRDIYASLEDLFPEDFQVPEEYSVPEDVYEYVQYKYPQLRSLLEDWLQVEPEDPDAKPAPEDI